MAFIRILLACLLIASGSLWAAADSHDSVSSLATSCTAPADGGTADGPLGSPGDADECGVLPQAVRSQDHVLRFAWREPHRQGPLEVFLPAPPEPPTPT